MQEAVEDFLDHGIKGKSPGTVANYRSIADHHLIPFIGAAKLKKLTADELDTWLDDRAEQLSTRTLRLVHLRPATRYGATSPARSSCPRARKAAHPGP